VEKRSKYLEINDDMTVTQKLEPGKVLIIVLDGEQGRAKMFEAVHHGQTVIETVKGRTARIRFEDGELF
jgi:hypothetical protein